MPFLFTCRRLFYAKVAVFLLKAGAPISFSPVKLCLTLQRALYQAQIAPSAEVVSPQDELKSNCSIYASRLAQAGKVLPVLRDWCAFVTG